MKLMLIGGGEIGRGNTSYETKEIDQEIVSMTEKDHPIFLFVGLASSFSDSYYDTIKKIYQDLGCETVYLKKNNLIHNPDLVQEKFEKADIIYIGGGDTIKLKEKVEEYHLQPLFEAALNRGCVLAGISAGAILLSKEGYSDSLILRGESDQYTFLSGFGFYPYSICPHYHADDQKTEQLKENLYKTHSSVIGIENQCALKVVDQDVQVISIQNHHAFQVSYTDQFLEKEM